MFLEDGDWDSANDYCEKVLDMDPENARAYLGKLLSELHLKKQDELKDQVKPFDSNNNYQKALRFADDELKSIFDGYIEHINARNEAARLAGLYDTAKKLMTMAYRASEYKVAAEHFEAIGEYLDSVYLARECYGKAETLQKEAEIARKDEILAEGKSRMTGDYAASYKSAIQMFKSIPGWKDADECICICQNRIQAIEAKAEAEHLEKERKAELVRIEAEKRARLRAMRIKKIAKIATPTVCGIIVFIILLTFVIIPNSKYNDAIDLMDAGKYTKAITVFKSLDGYRDSEDKISECNTAILEDKYNNAIALMNAEKYSAAISAFEALDGYKDSADKIEECNTAVLEAKYNYAIALMDAGNLDGAYSFFKELGNYKDAAEKARIIEKIQK
jgi:tetratricopeptide (TPR) repeat protein